MTAQLNVFIFSEGLLGKVFFKNSFVPMYATVCTLKAHV